MSEETKATAAPVGCVGDRAARYEGAGMTPVLALMRAEEDCVDMPGTNGNDAPDNKARQESATDKDSLDDACFKKAIIKHMQAGDIRSDAERKARAECTDSTPGLGQMGAGDAKAWRESTAIEDGVFARVWNAIQSMLGTKDKDELTSFKVVGNHWLITWSNDFKDRDGEIFTRKAIDDYINRIDMGVVPKPELWVWHIPGTRIGQAEWVDRHEHFVLAGGSFDDTPDGQSAKAYYAEHAGEKGISHGFKFSADQFDGKHYHQFNSFELSPLPLGGEANLFTSFEGVKALNMNERKEQELVSVFGKARAEQIIANLDKRGKALEAYEVEYKDFVATGTPAAAVNDKAVANAEAAFKDLFPDLLEGSTEALQGSTEAIKEVKALRLRMDAQDEAINKLRSQMSLAPRSVQSKSGVPEIQISKEDAKREFDIDGNEIVFDEFFGVKVKKNSFAALGEEGK